MGLGEYCGTEGKPGGEESPEGVEAVGDEGDDRGGEVGGFSSS